MINNLISEKSTDFLNKCASNLVKQRTVISNLSQQELADKLTNFSGYDFSEKIIIDMENGQEDIPFIYWIYTWQYYQNLEKILLAYDPTQQMYLSQMKIIDNIENEILEHHENNKT